MTAAARLMISRNNWKRKAVPRGTLLREARKEIRRLSASNRALRFSSAEKAAELNRLQIRIAILEAYSYGREDERLLPVPQPIPRIGTDESHRYAQIRALCVLLVIFAVIAFRAVPRALSVLQRSGRLPDVSPPHFTSVIHWTLRAGISLLRKVGVSEEPWLAIMDCSIDIVVRKALLVLRVPLSTLQRKGSAIGFADCECLGVRVSVTWNGPLVKKALTDIFAQAGEPIAIIKDKGTDLASGVQLYRTEQQAEHIRVIDDIGHVIANALKAQLADKIPFQRFLKVVAKGAARIRQTDLALYLPPKIRTKGRFQGISVVVNWAGKMLELLGGRGRAKEDSNIHRLRAAFCGLSQLRPFLEEFLAVLTVTDTLLTRMKQQGLNRKTCQEAKTLAKTLPESIVRARILEWLDRHLRICCQLNIGQQPLLVSSDVIESIFGAFKTIVQRNPRAELNRLVYVFPLLCGQHDEARISEAIENCSQRDMLHEISATLPPTMRQQRRKLLDAGEKSVPKTGENLHARDG
jgi:hypothetical protein